MTGEGPGWSGTQVVGVRDEEVLDSLGFKSVKETRLPYGREDVAMTRRAPLQFGLVRIGDGLAGIGDEFGFNVLDDLRGHGFRRKSLVLVNHPHGVLGGPERVHENQREGYLQACSGSQHLPQNDVQEPHPPGLVPPDGQEGFGLLQPHGSSQTSVELEESRPGEGIQGHVHVHGVVNLADARDILEGLYLGFSDLSAEVAAAPCLIQVPELLD